MRATIVTTVKTQIQQKYKKEATKKQQQQQL